MAPPTKDRATSQDRPSVSTGVERQPEVSAPEPWSSPQSPVRAAEALSADSPGAAGRARLMNGLQRAVGNNRSGRMTAGKALDKRADLDKHDPLGLSSEIPPLTKLIRLAQAVDQGDVRTIPRQLEDFVTDDDTRFLPLGVPTYALGSTMVARLLLLGLGEEAERFRTWFLDHEVKREVLRRPDPAHRGFLWELILEELLGQIPEHDADAALKVLDALLLLFGKLRDAAASSRRQGVTFIYNDPKFLRETFAGIQTAYQVVLDRAIADLGSGRGDKYLQIAKDRLENRLVALVDPEKDERNRNTAGQTIEITRSEFRKGGGRHLDFFARGKEARPRTVGFSFYDREMLLELASEKELSFGRITDIRRAQIQVLEQIYGLEKGKNGDLTSEARENKAAAAGLSLKNDDDWRSFLLAKFELHRKQSNAAEALTAVIKLLERSLHAFTTHSPHNLDDLGEPRDNYLTRQFPRALTGQLIHDCGVYALRIAYMLSLLRDHKDLQLRFRFIVLPLHVGLIITGKDLPLYLAHNDKITVAPTEYVTKLSEHWAKTDPRSEPRTPTGQDKEQVVKELAGQQFIAGVDLPFRLFETPRPKGGPEEIKRTMWTFYMESIAPAKVFGPAIANPKSPVYQLDLKYLNALALMKIHHNQKLLPFWNKDAPEIWRLHDDRLNEALADEKSAASYDELVKRYESAIKPKFDAVDQGYEQVRQALKEISDLLQAHPEAIPTEVSRTHSARFGQILPPPWWKHDFEVHLELLEKREYLDETWAVKQKAWAPFAEPLPPID